MRFVVHSRSSAARRPFAHRLVIRETEFRFEADDERPAIQAIYRALAADEVRNHMILDDVAQALEEGRSPVLLTERKDHLEFFVRHLTPLARNLVAMQGGMGVKRRREILGKLASIPDDEERIVLATGRFIGEGFDDTRLDTLFLALPVSWRGTLVQYAGHLHRSRHGKSEVRIVDYVDGQVPHARENVREAYEGLSFDGLRSVR